MRERWKKIDGFEGYEVSNTGKVRSYINNRYGIGREPHDLKQVKNAHGYGTVCLGRGNRRLVHRLVANAFIKNPKNLPLVRHLDDDPNNNMVDNLAWGTQVDNMQDCVRHGRLAGDTRAAINSRKKPVVAMTSDGKKIKVFESVSTAARELNLWPQHVCKVANGHLKQTGGYRFRYVKDGDYID